MTSTKKLQSLSFSVSEFLSTAIIPVSNITYAFPSFPVIGKQFITFQLIYQELNSNTAKLKFEQSLDGINFDDILDNAGNPLLVNLSAIDNSVTVNLFYINTAFIHCTLILNNLTSGSFTNYIYLTN